MESTFYMFISIIAIIVATLLHFMQKKIFINIDETFITLVYLKRVNENKANYFIPTIIRRFTRWHILYQTKDT